jgi:hypothetical protein
MVAFVAKFSREVRLINAIFFAGYGRAAASCQPVQADHHVYDRAMTRNGALPALVAHRDADAAAGPDGVASDA